MIAHNMSMEFLHFSKCVVMFVQSVSILDEDGVIHKNKCASLESCMLLSLRTKLHLYLASETIYERQNS